MIDATFLQKAADLAAVQEFDVDGVKFTSKPVHEVKPEPDELPPLIEVHSLSGFVDLIRAKIDSVHYQDLVNEFLIHIEDEVTVTLKHKESDEHGRRSKLLKASPVKFSGFQFGQWMNQEEFIIGVASKFSQTDDKDYVLKIASTLTNEAVIVSEDNGFAQKATTKAGLALQQVEVLKPQVNLAPFRTFPEIGQPISSFVFRARAGGQQPSLMLVEADGGKWKLDAINEIRRQLATLTSDEALKNITIVA